MYHEYSYPWGAVWWVWIVHMKRMWDNGVLQGAVAGPWSWWQYVVGRAVSQLQALSPCHNVLWPLGQGLPSKQRRFSQLCLQPSFDFAQDTNQPHFSLGKNTLTSHKWGNFICHDLTKRGLSAISHKACPRLVTPASLSSLIVCLFLKYDCGPKS